MGLESVPILLSILSTVWAVIKTIWDAVKARIVLIGTILGVVIPFVWKVLGNYILWKYVLYVALAVLVTLAIQPAMNLVTNLPVIQNHVQELFDMFPGISWYLWEGPFQFHVLYDGIKQSLVVWAAVLTAVFAVRKVRWCIQVALGGALKKAA